MERKKGKPWSSSGFFIFLFFDLMLQYFWANAVWKCTLSAFDLTSNRCFSHFLWLYSSFINHICLNSTPPIQDSPRKKAISLCIYDLSDSHSIADTTSWLGDNRVKFDILGGGGCPIWPIFQILDIFEKYFAGVCASLRLLPNIKFRSFESADWMLQRGKNIQYVVVQCFMLKS